MQPEVLITIPHYSYHGGVGNIYKTIKWTNEDHITYFYNTHGKKSGSFGFIPVMLIRYVIKIQKSRIVHLNPSLNFKSIFRDGVLLLIAKLFSKKVILFFHGWDHNFQNKITDNKVFRWFFASVFNKVDCYLLLGEIFKDNLEKLGVNPRKFYYLPTIAEDFYITNTDSPSRLDDKSIQLLFIAGFVPSKGLDIVLNTIGILNKSNEFNFNLTMIGDGPELEKCKQFALEKNLTNVIFTGYIEGVQKHNYLVAADILFLPSLSEGLPCVIMEGMLYGLSIVTRPIGGIPYWVKHNVNGWLSESTDPQVFANGIMSLVRDRDLMSHIRNNNQKTALENFTPDKIKNKLKSIYQVVAE